jgi:acyl phosphate:glycerol-3-phosphate acyltransferase
METLGAILLLAGAYAVGAIPWGVVLGRVFASTDLRSHGSKSTGSTNAYRVLGWRISVAVLVLDMLKGVVPVLVARWADADWWIVAAAGVATVIGHCWSPFIRFEGGKGMATGAGAIAAMVPWVLLVFPLMVLIVALTRYVSLASMAGTALATLGLIVAAFLGWVPVEAAFACLGLLAIILLRHQGNIQRLREGNERRLTRRPRRVETPHAS